jgi:hypothetical protein
VPGSPASSLFASVLIVVFTVQCKREPSEGESARGRELAERARRDATPRLEAPVPVDPPLEKSRVPDSGLPCDVDDVLARKCRRCHTNPARHTAPFELYTWDDTRSERMGLPLYVHIGRVVENGYMPLALPVNPPVERLTPDEKRILVDWVDAGAPKVPCEPSDAASSPVSPTKRKQKRQRTEGVP